MLRTPGGSGITSELTRRREFIQPSPDQSSYKTRHRRSRPTICSARLGGAKHMPPEKERRNAEQHRNKSEIEKI